MSKLWLTGANGILGSHIVEYWQALATEDGANNFDQLMTINRGKSLEDYPKQVNLNYEEFYSLEVDEEARAQNQTDVMLHLAFARSTDNKDIMESIRLLENVTEQCKKLNIGTIINISSQSVYDSFRDAAAEEDDLPKPGGIYGLAKYYTEKYLEDYAERHGIRVINIRLGALIGPGLDKRISTRMMKSALEEQDISITSGAEQFSFLYVGEAARMLMEIALNIDKAESKTYNVGTDEALSLKEMAEIISLVLQEDKLPEPEINVGESSGKQYNNTVNNDRLKKDFSLEANVSFYQAMQWEYDDMTKEKDAQNEK